MKKVFIASLVALFLFAAVASFAGESCSKTCAIKCAEAKTVMASAGDKAPAADPHAGCAVKEGDQGYHYHHRRRC